MVSSLKIKVAPQDLICESCKNYKDVDVETQAGSVNVIRTVQLPRYNLTVPIDSQSLEVGAYAKGVRKIVASFKAVKDCPICGEQHSIKHTILAVKTFLSDIYCCPVCEDDMTFCEFSSNINSDDDITIIGRLICQNCVCESGSEDSVNQETNKYIVKNTEKIDKQIIIHIENMMGELPYLQNTFKEVRT